MKIKNQLIWKEVEDYVLITLGLMLYAFAFTIFLMPYKIVTGGVTGTAAIVFYATKIPIQDTYMVINGLLLVVALKILGLKFLLKTIYAIFMLAFLLWLAGSIAPTNPDGSYVKILGEGQDFMSLLIGCTLTGTSLAIVFMNNGSTGGTDIIAASVNKYYNLSLGQVLIGVDFIIIGSCLFIPQYGNGPWRDHSRRTRLVHRTRHEGAVYPCQKAGEHHHLPTHQDDRPERFRIAIGRHRCVWRGIRQDQGELAQG